MAGRRYLKIIISFLFLSAICNYAQAQDPIALYKQFIELNQQNGDKLTTYQTLYDCYKANVVQLKSLRKGSDLYTQIRANMLRIWPYLENAAIYYASKNDNHNAALLAQSYIEMPMMEDFKGVDFNYSPNRAKLAYFVGSRYFNNREYVNSIPFLDDYVRTGEEQNRRNVFLCLIKACKESNNANLAWNAINDALRYYPSDFDIISMGINLCLETNNYTNLQLYLDKAFAVKPNDQSLISIQAKLYEDDKKYDLALNEFTKLLRAKPNSLETNKHVALNLYNLGALAANKAITETNGKAKGNLLDEAKKYFQDAVPYLENVVRAEPSSLKYNTALAVAYARSDNKDKLETVNKSLSAMGVGTVSTDVVPKMISFSNDPIPEAQNQTSVQYAEQSSVTSDGSRPKFSNFAKDMIESQINQWQQKDPYETANEYMARVTEDTRAKKVAELQSIAEKKYIDLYGCDVSIQDMELCPYDAENEVFLIKGAYGQLVLPVPRDNNQARLFEQNWKGVQLKSPQFFVSNDDLAIASVTFVTPTGLEYKFSNSDALQYTQTVVDVNFDAIDYSALAHNGSNTSVNIDKKSVTVGISDVDKDIPVNDTNNDHTFVVVISNENYSLVSKVHSAINDGNCFAEYCNKTLGIPTQNIIHCKDASYGMMLSAMKRLSDIANAFRNEDFKVIFYYAGHGIPDEASKDGFLLPTDANGQQTKVCYALKDLYSELGALGAKSVIVFLDACFSGAQRGEGMLMSARGIAIKAKEEDPKGNMVVFSAATADETAYPYKEKNHGLFTYYLLKKLQESKGEANLLEIGEYVQDKVSKQSILSNQKSQTPTVFAAPSVANDWKTWQLK